MLVLFYDYVGLFALKKWGGKGLHAEGMWWINRAGRMCWIVFLRETGWKGAGKVMYRLDAMHKGSLFFKKITLCGSDKCKYLLSLVDV